jgi:hypothetical protein
MKTRNLLYLLLTILLFSNSCRKEKSNPNALGFKGDIGQIAVVVNLSDSLKLFHQMKWIARGIPQLTSSVAFKAQVESDIISAQPNYFVSNRDIQANCSGILNYRNGVSANNANNFTPNDYDSSYFFEIEFNDCVMSVGVRSPDIDAENTDLPHLIVPTDPYGKAQLPYYGYTLDVSGNLDSILLDDDDIEDYYIWWVVAEETCPNKLLKKSESLCGNGRCDFFAGENKLNCVDCHDTIIKGKVLMILGVITGTDRKKFSNSHPDKEYQENHFKFKYELGFNYTIEDSTHGIYSSFSGGSGKALDLGHYSSWGNNCDIKRTKMKLNGNTKSNRGVSKTFFADSGVLHTNFNKNVHDIYFNLFELDRQIQLIRSTFSTFTDSFPIWSRNDSYTFNNPNIGNTSPANGVAGQRIKGQQVLYIKHDVPTSPTSSIWKGPVTIGSFTGDTLVVPLDGEMKVIFGIR